MGSGHGPMGRRSSNRGEYRRLHTRKKPARGGLMGRCGLPARQHVLGVIASQKRATAGTGALVVLPATQRISEALDALALPRKCGDARGPNLLGSMVTHGFTGRIVVGNSLTSLRLTGIGGSHFRSNFLCVDKISVPSARFIGPERNPCQCARRICGRGPE